MTEKSHVGMARCFFCLKEDRILLERRIDPATGQLRQTLPRDCGVVDMSPCHECEAYMKQGILLISVRSGELDQIAKHFRPFIPNPFRTGGWCVVKQEAIERIVENAELRADILRHRWTFVEDDVWNAIGLPRGEAEDAQP